MRRKIRVTYAETWAISSEGLFMYPLAKAFVPSLHEIGTTPNMLTLFNILVGASAAYSCANAWWISTCVLVLLYQLIDAMDGTLARFYGLVSEFGARLDEFCDNAYGTSISISACMCLYPNIYALIAQAAFSIFLCVAAASFSSARKNPRRTLMYVDDLSFLETVGLWGHESMTYTIIMNLCIVAFVHNNLGTGLQVPVFLWCTYVSFGMIGALFATDWAQSKCQKCVLLSKQSI